MNKSVEAILLGVLLELLECNFLGHDGRKVRKCRGGNMWEGEVVVEKYYYSPLRGYVPAHQAIGK